MPITLELTAEVVAALQAEAVRRRISVDALVEQLAESLPGKAAPSSDEAGSEENGSSRVERAEAVSRRPEPMSLRALARLPLQERHEILRKAKLVDHMDGMENWDALPWDESS